MTENAAHESGNKPFAPGEIWQDAKGKCHLVASVHGKIGRTPIATLTRHDMDKDAHYTQRRVWTQTKGWSRVKEAPKHEISL